MLCAIHVPLPWAHDRSAIRRVVDQVPSEAWLCIVLGFGDSPAATSPAIAREPDRIAAWLDAGGLAVVLSPVDRRAGLASLAALADELSAARTREPRRDRAGFIVLVQRRRPPLGDFRFDGFVTSFACSAHVLRAHVAALRVPEVLCFAALHGVMAGRPDVARLLVRQIPLRAALSSPRRSKPVTVMMPHRGAPALLAGALRSLAGDAKAHVLVGLDSRGAARYRRLCAAYPGVEFLRAEPAPIGPYAIRHALALRARTPELVFHDSDDVSCSDRIATLQAVRRRTAAAMVGSHELRIDELTARIKAFRFPLDVGAALRVRPNHPMMFPSTMIARGAYFATGGLSTDRAFAYDTQFVFRASFGLKLINADEFLYIRRRREGSLTTAPATALGSPLRTELLEHWTRDYQLVKRGRIPLDSSSLRVMSRAAPYRLVPVNAMASAVRRVPWLVAPGDRSR